MNLKELQAWLGEWDGRAALWLPMTDPTLAEIAAPEWRFAPALTGFTGSSGTVLVTRDRAALLTDSRYWVQAEGELLPGVELLRDLPGTDDVWIDWVRRALPEGGRLIADQNLISSAEAERMEDRLGAWVGYAFETRALPRLPAFAPVTPDIRALPRPGRTIAERIAAVRAQLPEGDERVLLTASPDVCAWLTNLRNAARPASPVFPAVAALTGDTLHLETNAPLSDACRRMLEDEGVVLTADLEAALRGAGVTDCPLVVNRKAVSAALMKRFEGFWSGEIVPAEPFFERAMSRKSPGEIELIEEAMRLDGVALTEFYAELDERLAAGERLGECDAVRLLHEHRAAQPGFMGESFGTISAFGANAAMPHYEPKPGRDAELKDGLLLIDSGGQYWCGTTDVTRMTPVGRISDEDRRVVGEVTRAMFCLANARFPEETPGSELDAEARGPLHERMGEDYGHGTGHGVGFVLNVHEGPMALSPRNHEFLFEGNVLSDEPGIYQEGVRGVRVENMLVALKDPTACGMLRWKHLTCVPIDVRTLPKSMGDAAEAVNAYNAWVRARLTPDLTTRARAWLERVTAPVKA